MEIYIPLIIALIGIVTAIVTAIVSYYLGKKATIDNKRIDRGFTIAEEIAVLFQEVSELEKSLCTVYDMNFSDRSFDEAWAVLEKLRVLYNQQFNQIKELSNLRESLNGKLKSARLYLRNSVLDDIQVFLDLSLFRYDTDGGVMFNTFEREFMRNLVSEDNRIARTDLAVKIINDLPKLVR